MHPENWHGLTIEEKTEAAKALFNSARGRFVAGQALARAILAMRAEPRPETSNIEDMEALGVLFEPWFTFFVDRQGGGA
jgi:hypothetical protein